MEAWEILAVTLSVPEVRHTTAWIFSSDSEHIQISVDVLFDCHVEASFIFFLIVPTRRQDSLFGKIFAHDRNSGGTEVI